MSPPCRKRVHIQPHRQWDTISNEQQANPDYNAWDPVVWYSQHGYNVSEMIKAPGKQTNS